MVAKEHKFFYIYKFSLYLRNESGSLFPPIHPITKSGTMADLGSIEKSVESELAEFNRYFRETLSSDKPFVNDFIRYLFKSEGKRIRPLVTLLTAGLHGGITQRTHVAATVLELTHTASLVHDDVVDEALWRRGALSVNALWRSHKAVLIGDYLFSVAITQAVHYQLYDILDTISDTIREMSVGELFQSDATMRLDLDEEGYLEVIRCKTATLMSSSAYAGANSAGASEEECGRMRRFGELLGMVFQIKDDMLDFAPLSKTGKSSCNDLKERKLTLPTIYALRNADPKKRKEVMKMIRNVEEGDNLERVRTFVLNSGAMNYTTNRMRGIAGEAVELLNAYPVSPCRDSLIGLVGYIMEREK